MWARRHRLVFLAFLATIPWLGWFASSASAPDPSDLQNRFDQELNSVRKAKLFEKLGDEQLAEIRRSSQSGDFNTVGQIMEKYRDNARAAFDALKKEHPNAEHQLNGYKQMQIHVRKTIRDLRETMLLAPAEYKPPLKIVEDDLTKIDDELLQSLFPSPLRNNASPQSAAGNPPIASSRSTSTVPVPAAPGGTSVLEQAPAPADNPPTASNAHPELDSNVNSGTPPSAKPDSPPSATSDNQTAGTSVENTQEKSEMNIQNCLITAVVTCGLAISSCAQLHAQFEQKDYLSPLESDKIRDAENTNERLKLFITFADDRLKKFQYELQHPSSNRHGELLNALMNGYVGCLDDAADLMQLGIEKQENIRAGIDLMSTRSKEFLEALNKIAADKIEIDIYKDNLDDAIEGTKDAISDSEKAKKAVAPPPVRRKN
jgi:hypothetical protein